VIPQKLGMLSSSASALKKRRRPSSFTLNTLSSSSSSSVHQTNQFKISKPDKSKLVKLKQKRVEERDLRVWLAVVVWEERRGLGAGGGGGGSD